MLRLTRSLSCFDLSFKFGTLILIICSCSDSKEQSKTIVPSYPVLSAQASEATTYQEFPASLEGKENIQIRSQVDGYLKKYLWKREH